MVFIAVAGGLALAALPELGAGLGLAEGGAGLAEAVGGAGELTGGAGELAEGAEGAGELAEGAEEGGGLVGDVGDAANGLAEEAEEGEAVEDAGEGAEEGAEEDVKKDGKKKKKKKKDEKKKEEKTEEEKNEEKRQQRIKEMNAAGGAAEKGVVAAQSAAGQAMEQAAALEAGTEAAVNQAADQAMNDAKANLQSVKDDLKAQTVERMDMADTFGSQEQMVEIDGKQLTVGELLETVSGGKALRGVVPTWAEWETHRHFRAIRGPEGSSRSVEPRCEEHEMSTESMADASTMVSFADVFGITAAVASTAASAGSGGGSFSCPFFSAGGSGSSGSSGANTSGVAGKSQSAGGIKAEVHFDSRSHTLFKTVSRYRITLPEAARMRFTPDAALRLNQIWRCKERLAQRAAQKEDVQPIRSELGAQTRDFFRLYGSHIMRGPVRLGGVYAIRGEAWALETMSALELESSASEACRQESEKGSSSSVTVQGSVGFLGIGGSAGYSHSSQSGQASGGTVSAASAQGSEASTKTGKTSTRTETSLIGGQPTKDIAQWTASLLQGDEYLEVFDRGTELVPFWDVVRYAYDDVGYFRDVPLEDGEYDKLIRGSRLSPIDGHRVLGPDAHKDLREGWVVCNGLTTDQVTVNTAPEVCARLAEFLELEFFSLYGEDCYCKYCKGSFLPTQLEAHRQECMAKQKHETGIEKMLSGGDYELRQDDPLDDRSLGYYLVKPVTCPLCGECVPATLLDKHIQTGACTFDMHIYSTDGLTSKEKQEYTDFKMHEVDGVGFKSGYYRLSCRCNLNYVSPPEGFSLVPKSSAVGGFELLPTFVMFEDKLDESIRRLFRRGYKRTIESDELTLRYETLDRLFYYVKKKETDHLLQTLFDAQQQAAVRGCINNVRDGETLLSMACRNGDVDVARLLIEQRASPNLASTASGGTSVEVETQPLLAAISKCHLETVSLLLERRANVNLRLDGADQAEWADRLHPGFRRSKRTDAPLQVAIQKYSTYTSPEQYDEFAAMHLEGVIALMIANYGAVALPAQWGLTKKRMLKFNPIVKDLLEQAIMHRLATFEHFLGSLIQRVDGQGRKHLRSGVLKKVARELGELVSLTEDFAKQEQKRMIRLAVITNSLSNVKKLFTRMDARSTAGRKCRKHLQLMAKTLLAAQVSLKPESYVVIFWEARPEFHLARGQCVKRYDGSGKWSVQVSLGLQTRRWIFDEEKLVPADSEELVNVVLPEPARPSAEQAGRRAAKLALPKLDAKRKTQACLPWCLDGTFALLRRNFGQLQKRHRDVFDGSVVGPHAARAAGMCDELLTGNRRECEFLKTTGNLGAVLYLIGKAPCSTTTVRLHACRALTRLLLSGEAAADEAANNQAVEILLEMLRQSDDDALLLAYGCDALFRVLDGSGSENARRAADLGGHELLLEVINNHFGHKVTQAYACMALKVILGRHADAVFKLKDTNRGVIGVLGETLGKGLAYHPLAQMAPVVIHALVRQCQEDDQALAALLRDGEAAEGAHKALKALKQSMDDYPNYPLRAKTTGFTLVRLCTGILRSRQKSDFSVGLALEVCEVVAALLRRHPQSATRAVGEGNANLVPEIVAVLSRARDIEEDLSTAVPADQSKEGKGQAQDDLKEAQACTQAACKALRWILVRCAHGAYPHSGKIRAALQDVLSRRCTRGMDVEASGALAEVFRLFPEQADEALKDQDAVLQLTSRLQAAKDKLEQAELCRALAWLPLVRHHVQLGDSTQLSAPKLACSLMKLLEGEATATDGRCPRLQQQALMCLLHLVAPEDVDLDDKAMALLTDVRKAVRDYQGEGEGPKNLDIVGGQGKGDQKPKGLLFIWAIVRQNPGNYSIEVYGDRLLRRLSWGAQLEVVADQRGKRTLRVVDGVDELLKKMDDQRGDPNVQGLGCYHLFQAVAGDALLAKSRKDDVVKRLEQAKAQAPKDLIVKEFADKALRQLGAFDAGEDTSLVSAAGMAIGGIERSVGRDFTELMADFRSVCGEARRLFIVPVTDRLRQIGGK